MVHRVFAVHTFSRLPRLVAAIAGFLSALLAVALPIGYFSIGREALVAELETKAAIKADTINQLIGASPELWQYQEHRLRELLRRFPSERADESAVIINADQEVVAASDGVVGSPYLMRSAALADNGVGLGQVEIRRSLIPLLMRTGLAAVLGLLLALLVFLVLRRVPQQARRMLDTMYDEKERAQVTLSSIGEGVITTNDEEVIEFLNPVAELITGWSQAEARGRHLSEVMQLLDEKTRQPTATSMGLALRENRINSTEAQVLLRTRDGIERAVEDKAAPIHDRHGRVVGGVVVLQDVSAARRMAQRLSWAATHDALTGLFNRSEFERLVDAALESAHNQGAQHVLMYMDLDQFKLVNDSCGHAAGDTLLRQVSSRLQGKLRQSDTLARLGGDEFGALLEGCPLDRAELIAADLVSALGDYRLIVESKAFSVGISIGLVVINAQSQSAAEVFAAADSACYAAKERGSNQVRVYHGADEHIVQRREEVNWALRLTRTLEEERFTLHYQSYQGLGVGDNAGQHIEILLRMIDEDGQLVMPGSFIPAAERYNVMPDIDRWVIRNVFARYHDLARQLGAPLTCAINLSGTTIKSSGLCEFIRSHALVHDLPRRSICFEITETATINNLRGAAQFMHDIKGLGFLFALDDFGIGTSSFGYLRNLPVDLLKIDGSFVRDIATDPLDRAMAETINRVGHIMGLETVGEFAESQTVIDELREMGVNFAQGYAVHKPQRLPAPLTHRDRLPVLTTTVEEPATPGL